MKWFSKDEGKAWVLTPFNKAVPAKILTTFPVVIGSGDECDIIFQDPDLEDKHAQIGADGKSLEIHDLNTRSGTYVSDKAISKVRLKPGSVHQVRVGGVRFILEFVVPPEELLNPPVRWFYSHKMMKYGPLTAEAMFEAVAKGRLLPTDEVWNSESERRVKASEVRGLFDSNAESPPGLDSAQAQSHGPDLSSFQIGPVGSGAITCPSCWYKFDADQVLYIARHQSLRGDTILGSDSMQRFLPSRFTPDGHAVDAGGMVCPDMACPRCHLRMPASILTMPPIFLSIVGAPGSGKSYMLASMCWRLRQTLTQVFGIQFLDADAESNIWLSEYESTLFMHNREDELKVIKKTELTGDLYQRATINGMEVLLPRSSAFALQTIPRSGREEIHRTLILYDNAGEHFQPGKDTASNPGTQHLGHAEGILFLYDPTKDPRFRRVLKSDDVQLSIDHHVERQDTLLAEMIRRIRLHLNIDARQKINKPLIVVISKADVLKQYIQLGREPWRWDETQNQTALDMNEIMGVSFGMRHLLNTIAPELVTTVEGFAENVIFVPISALGCSPQPIKGSTSSGKTTLAVRASDIKPVWAEVPLLVLLAQMGIVPILRQASHDAQSPEESHFDGSYFHLNHPLLPNRLTVPASYAGFEVQCPRTGVRLHVPRIQEQQA